MKRGFSRLRTISFGEWYLFAIGSGTLAVMVLLCLGAHGLFAKVPGG